MLGCSWHSCGDFVASASMDETSKVWDLNRYVIVYNLFFFYMCKFKRGERVVFLGKISNNLENCFSVIVKALG